MFGEWLYAKHTVYYDSLPHYFLEFDIYDKNTRTFLSTSERRKLLFGSPVVSVPVLYQGRSPSMKEIKSLIDKSLYKTDEWKENLKQGLADTSQIWKETAPSDEMEGLYIKVEQDKIVTDRCKYVRSTFLTSVLESETHWADRPIVPNRLAEGVDIYGG
jgi:hypothetical protein